MDTISSNVAQPVFRMNLDDDPLLFKEGEVAFALNAVVGKSFYKNAKGNQKNTTTPSGFFYLGEAVVDSKRRVLFYVNPTTGQGQIGMFRNKSYVPSITSVKFNFRIDKQIQAKVKISYKGEIIVYFTDDFNPMRRINLNNIPMLLGDIDIDAINVYQNYSTPDIRISEVTNNGSLLSGSYFIIAQYADANGNALSSWFTPVGPVPIIKGSVEDSFDFTEGVLSNEQTNKAIKITMANNDLSFEFMNVGFIKLAEGVHRPFKVATIPTSQTTYIFNGTGNVPEELDLQEVTKPVTTYRTAKTIEIVDDVLMWGNLKAKKTDNLQSYFNNLQVQWQVDRQLSTDNTTNYVNPLSTPYRRVYRYGESYIIGIVLIYKDGSKSQVFIVPGRKLNKKSDGTAITQTLDQFGNTLTGGWDNSIIQVLPPPGTDQNLDVDVDTVRWKVYNTAYQAGTELVGSTGPSAFGEMGYYESSDTFPNNPLIWGANAGQKITLHKMPDQTVIPLQEAAGGGAEDPVYINYLGIRFPNITNVINSLPVEVKNRIQGWEVVTADRTYNKSIIASGLMYNTLYNNWRLPYGGVDDIRIYSNYPFNDLRKDPYYFKFGATDPIPQFIRTNQPELDGAYTGVINDQYYNNIFTFVSPETSFDKNMLYKGRLTVTGELWGKAKEHFLHVRPYPRFDDSAGGSTGDYSALHNVAVGWYNNYTKPRFGQVSRQIRDAVYVPFNSQVTTGNIGKPFQNILGESTVVLAIPNVLLNPIKVDTSRELLGRGPDNPVNDELYSPTAPFERDISSYYGNITRVIENQYGDVYNYSWRSTNYNNYNVTNNSIVFGGDTFVGRFTIKRQHVFYKNAKAYIDWVDEQKIVDLKNQPTIANTRFYAYVKDNTRGESNGLNRNEDHLGFTPLIISGVPVFYVEADDNLAYRLNGQLEFETFYRNLLNGSVDINTWLGIQYIDQDNYYAINKDLSAQNNLSFYSNTSPFFDPLIDEALEYYGRAIYSLSSSAESIFDNWQIYLPRNYYDFPKSDGKLIDIKYLGNYRTIFRLENKIREDRLYSVIQTDGEAINLGDGKLFSKKPTELVTADNMYSGTRSQWCFNNTPYGAFTADADRGVVFNLGNALKDLGPDSSSYKWFQENLPFKLSKIIAGTENIDNPANPEGIGLLSVYDGDNKIWYLTKKDYDLINPDKAEDYSFSDGKFYYKENIVSLTDKSHFINCSFTIGYSIINQGWCSFYSFIPNYYLAIDNMFYSGVGPNFIYSHDSIHNHIYYEKSCSHIIEMVIKNDNLNAFYNLWHSFVTKAFLNYPDGRQAEQKFVTYNKAIVYNTLQCSGLLELTVQDENDLSSLFTTLSNTATSRKVALRRNNIEFNFSQVYDLGDTLNNDQGFFTKRWSLLQLEYFIDKVLDNTLLDYKRDYKEDAAIREAYTRMRLILDNRNDVTITTYVMGKASKLLMM